MEKNNEINKSECKKSLQPIINKIVNHIMDKVGQNHYLYGGEKRVTIKIQMAIEDLLRKILGELEGLDLYKVSGNSIKNYLRHQQRPLIKEYLHKEGYKQFLVDIKDLDNNKQIVIDHGILDNDYTRHEFLNKKVTRLTQFQYKEWLEKYIDQGGNIENYRDRLYRDDILSQLPGQKIVIPEDIKLTGSLSIQLLLNNIDDFSFLCPNLGHSNIYTPDGGILKNDSDKLEIQYGEKINYGPTIYINTVPSNLSKEKFNELQKSHVNDILNSFMSRILEGINSSSFE